MSVVVTAEKAVVNWEIPETTPTSNAQPTANAEAKPTKKDKK